MSDHHGGFYVLRDDAEVVRIALDVARDYLHDTAPGDARLLTVAGRQRVSALLVAPSAAGRFDAETAQWVRANLAFGARLARAAQAPVWAYEYDNSRGSESAWQFDAGGTLTSEATTPWDASTGRALDGLLADLDAPRLAVEFDIPAATAPFVIAVDGAPPDADAVQRWLDARPRMYWPTGPVSIVLFMPETAVAELFKVAERLHTRPGSVIEALWELAKPQIYRAIPLVEHDHLDGDAAHGAAPPSREVHLPLPLDGALEPLDAAAPKIPIRLALAEHTIHEMQTLALAADRSQSFVLQATYRYGRPHLFASE